MAILVLDPLAEEQIKAERRARGIDRFDEVWDGVYVMSPSPNNEHQRIAGKLLAIFDYEFVPEAGMVLTSVTVSDRGEGWLGNFRIPDIAVFLEDSVARDHGTHWEGGPDLAVEILSREDRARDKIPFYSKIGTRELIIIDRAPWQLELYRAEGGALSLVGISSPARCDLLSSVVLPVTFRLVPGEPRPRIEVAHRDGRAWLV